MDKKFRLTKSIASKLLETYQLELKKYARVKAGIENSSAFITTNKGRFVIRVYRSLDKGVLWFKQEADFMNYLNSLGIPVPKIIANSKGSLISTFKEKGKVRKYILMEYVDGRHLEPSDIPLIPKVATFQALMHRAALQVEPTGRFKKAPVTKIIKFLSGFKKAHAIPGTFWKQALEIINDLTAQLKKHSIFIDKLPSGPIHLDYDSDNIIIQNFEVKGIIDFDDMVTMPFSVDLANSLHYWSYMNKRKDYKKYLATYLQHYQLKKKLNQKELFYLPLFMRLRNVSIALVLATRNIKGIHPSEPSELLKFDSVLNKLQF